MKNFSVNTGNAKVDNLIKRIIKWTSAAVSVLIVLFFIFHIMRVGLSFWLYGTLARLVTTYLGLDYYMAQFVAIVLSICLTLAIPYILWFVLLGRKKWVVVFIVITITGAITILMYTVGYKVYFDRTTGKPLRYYADTPNGRHFSFTKGFDITYGIKFEPYTSDVALGNTGTVVDDQAKIKLFAKGELDIQWFNSYNKVDRLIGKDILIDNIFVLSLEKAISISPYTIISVSVVNNSASYNTLKFTESCYIYDDSKILSKSMDYWVYDIHYHSPTWEFSSYGGDKMTLYIVFDFLQLSKEKLYKLGIQNTIVDFEVR